MAKLINLKAHSKFRNRNSKSLPAAEGKLFYFPKPYLWPNSSGCLQPGTSGQMGAPSGTLTTQQPYLPISENPPEIIGPDESSTDIKD